MLILAGTRWSNISGQLVRYKTMMKIERAKMKWITRSRVHVDRMACPRLITPFIDSGAEFVFVPTSKVLEIAQKTGAIPFDTLGAELHHRDSLCTLDVIIKEFESTDKALQ